MWNNVQNSYASSRRGIVYRGARRRHMQYIESCKWSRIVVSNDQWCVSHESTGVFIAREREVPDAHIIDDMAQLVRQ